MAKAARLAVLFAGCVYSVGCSQDASNPAGEPEVPTTSTADDEKSAIDDPNHFKVRFETSEGDFVVAVAPGWAPQGAARFRELVEIGFYDDCRFFRVMPGFVAQFGVNGDPAVMEKWRNANLESEEQLVLNKRGRLTFAMSPGDANTRTTQVFINYAHNAHLDGEGFAPFGEVIEGMEVVGALNGEHGQKPDQFRIQTEGNAYLDSEYPDLDYIIKATVIEPKSTPPEEGGEDQP